ncbi:flagellar hook-length control protein FliK [Stenotrophomonas sp. MMGLT7]|uniref:flagellar hook-length control protein FliK n=1 Tax=Stenotrophomonas sp. MMGLT7 TaxID=2901227 RepID=UPI001E284BB6|nr:flagellar hook-length control protein FliK [Stenotrophomonas sp. MMGLT7]
MSGLSSMASVSATGSARGTAGSAPADDTQSAGGDGAFAQMIGAGSARTPAPADKAAAGKQRQPADGGSGNDAGKASKPPGNKMDKPADTQQAAETDATDAPGSAQPAEEHEDAAADGPPWPPAGLAGLALVPASAPATAAPPPGDAAAAARAPASGDGPAAPAAAAAAAAGAAALSAPGKADAAAPAAEAAVQLLAAAAGDGPSLDNAAQDSGLQATARDGDGFAALLSAAQPAAAAKAESTVFAGSPTATPDLDGDFGDAVGVRLGWLAEQKVGHAHIHINPDKLGPVEVRLQLDGDRVHASFSSAHADVRQALEDSLPRLREMLGQQGLQLAQADVGRQQQGQGGAPQAEGMLADGIDGMEGIEASTATLSPVALRLRGLLDAYA